MGLELAEQRLLEALRAADTPLRMDLRVVGGRAARAYARHVRGRWIPALPNRPWSAAWNGADLVHLIGLDLPPPRHKPFVATVYDLAPLHYDDEGSLPPWVNEIAERAALLLAPSAFTAGELHEHLDVPRERIHVFGGGPALDAGDAEPLTLPELEALGIEAPLILRYGGYTERKNVALLLEAWAMVPKGTLVLAGPPQAARAALLAGAPSLDRVVVLDYVRKELLARLLRTAAVLVSPSLYEGFGLPSLEALAASTPVVAMATPFAEEIAGGAAILVANSREAFAASIGTVISDAQLAERLRCAGRKRAAGFTWTGAADKVVWAYENANSR